MRKHSGFIAIATALAISVSLIYMKPTSAQNDSDRIAELTRQIRDLQQGLKDLDNSHRTELSTKDGLLKTESSLVSLITERVPVGTIFAYAGEFTEDLKKQGWLLCNGAELAVKGNEALYKAIGRAHGASDNNHFNLPDYRGEFLRGVAGDTSTDLDKNLRRAPAPNGNQGNKVGSLQGNAFISHNHEISDPGHIHAVADNQHTHRVIDPGHLHNARGQNEAFMEYSGTPDPTRDGQVNAFNTQGPPPPLFKTTAHAKTDITLAPSNSNITIGRIGTGIHILVAGSSETRPNNAYVNYIIRVR